MIYNSKYYLHIPCKNNECKFQFFKIDLIIRESSWELTQTPIDACIFDMCIGVVIVV